MTVGRKKSTAAWRELMDFLAERSRSPPKEVSWKYDRRTDYLYQQTEDGLEVWIPFIYLFPYEGFGNAAAVRIDARYMASVLFRNSDEGHRRYGTHPHYHGLDVLRVAPHIILRRKGNTFRL